MVTKVRDAPNANPDGGRPGRCVACLPRSHSFALSGFLISVLRPRACALGCILPPLCGLIDCCACLQSVGESAIWVGRSEIQDGKILSENKMKAVFSERYATPESQ